jgi:hypothetical protein
MKHTLLAFAFAAPLFAAAQDLPQPSPKGKVEQIVGLTKVTVEYSRPSAKGRVIFGDLVPTGQLWRLGANGCTTISFDGPVVIGGQDSKVPAGTYSLFAEPMDGAWLFHLNKNIELWGTDGFKAEEDVAVWKAETADNEHTETLTIGFDEVKDDKARVDVRWDKVRASFWINADATEQAMANIKTAMAQKDIKSGTYHRCARYCVDKGVMLPEALDWAQKAVGMEKERKYWMLHTLALCQAANGNYKEAVVTARESMGLAAKEGDNGYVKMNEVKIAEWASK